MKRTFLSRETSCLTRDIPYNTLMTENLNDFESALIAAAEKGPLTDYVVDDVYKALGLLPYQYGTYIAYIARLNRTIKPRVLMAVGGGSQFSGRYPVYALKK